MISQVFLPRERLGTVGASMRGLPCVLAHVVCEVLLAREGFCAVRALVRGFPCMLTDMVHCEQ